MGQAAASQADVSGGTALHYAATHGEVAGLPCLGIASCSKIQLRVSNTLSYVEAQP